MKNLCISISLAIIILSSCGNPAGEGQFPGEEYPESIILTKDVLRDKIMGGWAGQVIGCTYGGPTEFKYNGTMIQDYIPIEWDSTKMEWYYKHAPGLYDDIYMDLTFVDVFEKEGLDAPATSHAKAFANAEYWLWHANQAARYNILAGMEPPATGHWENNPHADDIDFQIEADFAGLMCPAMVNASSDICDRVGHIMNYGDGWYGGVYVAAMYSLSFWMEDVASVVEEALKTIPEESEFHSCISDVMKWHSEYPEDWRRTWFEVEKKWSSDIGCPDGVFKPFNIDAKINAAYIVIGLLYGEGDFGLSLEISTRCGQDSDCNPASAGGILGTILGYDAIPDKWKAGLDRVEDMDFKYTTISLNDTYDMSFRHALQMIEKQGGVVEGSEVEIALQKPEAVRFEKAFEGHYPVKVVDMGWGGRQLENGGSLEHELAFQGIGFVIRGNAFKDDDLPDRELDVEVYLDGELLETALMPTAFIRRKHDVSWKYKLEDGPHSLKMKLKDAPAGYGIQLDHVLVYGSDSK